MPKTKKPEKEKMKFALIRIPESTRDVLAQRATRRNPMWKIADELIRKAMGAK